MVLLRATPDGEPYLEQPLLMVFDRESQDLTKLLLLPQQQRIHMRPGPRWPVPYCSIWTATVWEPQKLDPLQENTEADPCGLIPLFEDAQQRLYLPCPRCFPPIPIPLPGDPGYLAAFKTASAQRQVIL